MSLTQENYFSILDDDSLIHIFKFLSAKEKVKIQRVCKRWQILSKLSWSSLQQLNVSTLIRKNILNAIDYFVNKNNIEFFCNILSYCGFYLKSLKVIFNMDLEDVYEHKQKLITFDLPIIGRLCPNLESIDIRCTTKIMFYEVKELANNCKNIKILKLRNLDGICIEKQFYEIESDLCKLFANNPKINNLNLNSIYLEYGFCFSFLSHSIENIKIQLQGHYLYSLILSFPNLINLKLFKMNFFADIKSEGISKIIDSLQRCHKLNKLSLNMNMIYDSSIEDSLSELFKKVPLKHLKLRNSLITGTCLLNLKENLIETMKLESCKQIKHKNLQICLTHFKNLKVFRSFYHNDKVFKQTTNLKNLECLSLFSYSWNNLNSDACLNINYILNLKNLKRLNLWSLCEVNDDFLRIIAEQLKHLYHLDLSFSRNITDFGLNFLCKFPNLKELYCNYICHVTGEGLINFKNLTHLECSGCNLKKKFMIYVIKNCQDLQLLDVAENERIANVFLEGAVKLTKKRKNGKLLTINVDNCDVDFDKLVNDSPNLQIISVHKTQAKHYLLE